MTDQRPTAPDLDWRGALPRSVAFDDIYFSDDGVRETHHVFIDGNDLPARFKTAPSFTIGELGFGTGLNILTAWDLWRRTAKPQGSKLHFLSVEKYPLTDRDLTRAHAAWPEVAPLAARLRDRLPVRHPGVHALFLDDDVSLTLLYGDAAQILEEAHAEVDAWFLDGFSPAKNPQMWSPAVMAQVARLSAPGATFATFTVAGAVRRALEAAGFETEKRPGYGRKKDMLAGRLAGRPAAPSAAPWFSPEREKRLAPGARVGVIGAGIAGAAMARALTVHGYSPRVFDPRPPGEGASGNPIGLFMPRVDVGDTPQGRFHCESYLFAVRAYARLPSDLFNPCGVALEGEGPEDAARFDKLIAAGRLPDGWLVRDGNALVFPQGGLVSPRALIRHLLEGVEIRTQAVDAIRPAGATWIAETADGAHELDAMVVANALDAVHFPQLAQLPLAGAAGQVDWFPDASAPARPRVFGAYAAPHPEGGLVLGATYEPIAPGETPAVSKAATESNIDTLRQRAPDLVARLDPEKAVSRAAVRCTTPDRMPVSGAVPDWAFFADAYEGLRTGRRETYPNAAYQDGLYALTGLGSRGFITAPLAAAAVAAAMAGAPAPLSARAREAVHPARFFIRDLKRGKTGPR